MKKLFILVLSITLFSACENEPFDGEIPDIASENSGNENGTENGTNTDNNTLSSYSYYKTIAQSGPFGDSEINTDMTFNSNGQFLNQSAEVTFANTTINSIGTITRDTSGKITQTQSSIDGAVTSTTTLNYSGNDIISLDFEDEEYPEDNYTYNFAYDGNTVTRIETGSTDSTIFTFNADGLLSNRKTLDNGTTTMEEAFIYSDGNLVSSEITGENARILSYTYDSNTNPTKATFNEFYRIMNYDDNYDEQIEHWQATFFSTNNMISVTTSQGTSNLTIEYDSENRITSRSGSINSALIPNPTQSGDITINEVFEYQN
jgi:hypothetical protein